MKKSSVLEGLTNEEKSKLGYACSGLNLRGEFGMIAKEAIIPNRADKSGDQELATSVGRTINETVKAHLRHSLRERVAAVRRAVDALLRQRKTLPYGE